VSGEEGSACSLLLLTRALKIATCNLRVLEISSGSVISALRRLYRLVRVLSRTSSTSSWVRRVLFTYSLTYSRTDNNNNNNNNKQATRVEQQQIKFFELLDKLEPNARIRASREMFDSNTRLMRYWKMRTHLIELLARLIELGQNSSEDISAATETLNQLADAISKDGITPKLLAAHMKVLINVQKRGSSNVNVLAYQAWRLLQKHTIMDSTALCSLVQVVIGPATEPNEMRIRRAVCMLGETMGVWRDQNERAKQLKEKRKIEKQKRIEREKLKRQTERKKRVENTLCVGRRVDLLWPSEKKWFRGSVAALDKASGGRKIPCLIHYDDGDRKWHDMSAFQWEIASDDEEMIRVLENDEMDVVEEEEEEKEKEKENDDGMITIRDELRQSLTSKRQCRSFTARLLNKWLMNLCKAKDLSSEYRLFVLNFVATASEKWKTLESCAGLYLPRLAELLLRTCKVELARFVSKRKLAQLSYDSDSLGALVCGVFLFFFFLSLIFQQLISTHKHTHTRRYECACTLRSGFVQPKIRVMLVFSRN